ncbi:MAG: HAD hydrolase-like protein [Gammaproteobacteria bacterium]
MISAIYWCPHLLEDGCDCRKPQPGLLMQAMVEAGVAAADTIVVGDSVRDLLAARHAGCRAILVQTGRGRESEREARSLGFNEVHNDLAAVVGYVLGGEHSS